MLPAGLAGSAVVGGLLIFAARSTQLAPVWWRTFERDDPEADRIAINLENALVNEMHRTDRPTEPGSGHQGPPRSQGDDGVWRSQVWGVSLNAQDVNAWLNRRLRKWIENRDDAVRWPDGLSELQVEFSGELVRVGVRLQEPGGDRSPVFSASVRPEVRADGSLWLETNWVHAGRLPLPAAWVLGEAESRFAPAVEGDQTAEAALDQTLLVLAGREPAMESAAIELGDGRRVRLLGVRLHRGRAEILCRTESPRSRAAVDRPTLPKHATHPPVLAGPLAAGR